MFFRTISAVLVTVTLALMSVGCGADEGTESMSAQVNPALIARSLESQRFEVVAQNDESAIVEGGTLVSATLGETALVVESYEFVTEFGVKLVVSSDTPIRSGAKSLVIIIEHEHGTYALTADVQVM